MLNYVVQLFWRFYACTVTDNRFYCSSQSRSSMDYIDHPKAGSEKVGSSSDGGLISMIDRKMEEHSKNLLHVIDGLSVRMCQLDNRTRKIEDTVDELKDSSEFNHGRTEGKLTQLENILTEVIFNFTVSVLGHLPFLRSFFLNLNFPSN